MTVAVSEQLIWLIWIVALMGGIGSVLRSFVTNIRGRLGWGVMLVNTVAGAIMGLLASVSLESSIELVVAAGLLGGLSTFSGVARDAFYYWNRGRIIQTILTMIGNLSLPVVALWIVRGLISGEW